MSPSLDGRSLYLCTPLRDDLLAFVEACVRGGVDVVQLRDRDHDDRAILAGAERLAERCRALGVPFVVNDRCDLARCAGADGVHVGQDDMAVEDARKILGRGAIIGLSVKTVDEANAAPVELIDYVGSGGVYVTTSKQQKSAPIGTAGLARVIAALHARAPKLPVCGIAGIDAGNAAPVIAAGADGVAVISALSLAPDPAAAARTLRGIVDATLAKRGA